MGAKLDIGRSYKSQTRVEEWMTAEKAGNKGVDVLSTPMLLQLIEAAASEALVMELFRRGRVSIGKACALLRIPREAFARRADDLGIPYFLINKDDWAAELATIEAWRRL